MVTGQIGLRGLHVQFHVAGDQRDDQGHAQIQLQHMAEAIVQEMVQKLKHAIHRFALVSIDFSCFQLK